MKAEEMSREMLAGYIDHSVLKPEFSVEEAKKNIQIGIDYGCKTVSVMPQYMGLACDMTKNTQTGVNIGLDFPFGVNLSDIRLRMMEEYCSKYDLYDVDVVAPYGLVRSGKYGEVLKDLSALAAMAHKYGKLFKVIFEVDALEKKHIYELTEICIDAGVDYTKSSTGFFTGNKQEGATIEVMEIMLNAAKGRIKVKAAGHIRTRDHFLRLVDMGVDRMGIGYKSTPIVLGDN